MKHLYIINEQCSYMTRWTAAPPCILDEYIKKVGGQDDTLSATTGQNPPK
jgi:hypothetical protein